MNEVNVDELGPVDYLVVEFPRGTSNFDGSIAAELAKLVDKGIIHFLDLLIVHNAVGEAYASGSSAPSIAAWATSRQPFS